MSRSEPSLLGQCIAEFFATAVFLSFECTYRLYNEIEGILRTNKQAKIIAIGKVAKEYLISTHREHKMIYHPSYYARIGESWRFDLDLRKLL